MAADLTNKITDTRNAARPASTTVSVARSAGGSSLSCASLTGWPTASKVHFVTYQIDTNNDPVAGTQLDCYGIVSGSSIGSLTVVDGTDAGHSVGDIVEMLPTAAWGQDLSDALMVAHNRDGTLQTVAVSKGGTGATTFTDGGVLIGNDTGAVQVTSAGTSGQVLTSSGTGADPTWQTNSATGYISLLKANSGTDTTASATNVDTSAISGLTAKDTLLVYFDFQSATQGTSEPLLYSTTDSKTLLNLGAGATNGAGYFVAGTARIRQAQTASTTYNAIATGVNASAFAVNSGGSIGTAGYILQTTSNTAWTGSWTLALRHGGVTAGGTFAWSWAIYKISGQ